MECRKIEHGSEDYWQAVEVRRDVLRRPLGLDYTSEQLNAESSFHHFVCVNEGEIVAYAMATSEESMDLTIRIKQVAVSTCLQGTGIGRLLMSYVEEWGLEQGFESAFLHSRGYAIPFYERLGYVGFGNIFEEVGIPHQKMLKKL